MSYVVSRCDMIQTQSCCPISSTPYLDQIWPCLGAHPPLCGWACQRAWGDPDGARSGV